VDEVAAWQGFRSRRGSGIFGGGPAHVVPRRLAKVGCRPPALSHDGDTQRHQALNRAVGYQINFGAVPQHGSIFILGRVCAEAKLLSIQQRTPPSVLTQISGISRLLRWRFIVARSDVHYFALQPASKGRCFRKSSGHRCRLDWDRPPFLDVVRANFRNASHFREHPKDLLRV